MNIVVLSDFGRVTGGASAVAIASARGLAARGHRVIFVSGMGRVDPELGAAGIEVIRTDLPADRAPSRLRTALQRTWNTAAAGALRRRLASLDPGDTVVHLHGWTKALSPSVARAAIGGGFKLACTLHDYAVACPRGGFFDHRRMDHCGVRSLSWDCVTRDCDPRGYVTKLGRTLRHVTQRSAGGIPRGVDALIVVSRFSRTILEPYLPAPEAVFEVPNPIEAAHDRPVDVGGNRNLVMIGRITIDKGALLLARAGRACDAPVVFVGTGPRQDAVRAHHPSAVITGWVPQAAVQAHLRAARALVFPSVQYETQGLVVPEAAALGVPAVVSDTSAATEGVRDGVTGLWFKNGDAASLASALTRLGDDALVRRLGAAAYQAYWAAPPTLARHVDRLERVYGSILRDRAHAPSAAVDRSR